MKYARIVLLFIVAAFALAHGASPALGSAILWNIGGSPNTAASTANFTSAGVLEDLTGATVFNVTGNASGLVATDGGTGISLTYTSGNASANNGKNTKFANPLLDQYHYFNNIGPATLQVSGLSSNLAANTTYKLYLFGTGDNTNQNSTFTFNGISQTTNSANPPANPTARSAIYVFETGGAVSDTLDFTWARPAGHQFAGFNGFAITELGDVPNSIGLNFVDGRNSSGQEILGVAQSAGVVPQLFWNNTDANTAGDGLHGTKNTTNIASPIADTLVDNTGTATGVTVSWTGNTTWSAPDEASANADDVLMSDYLVTENNAGPDASVTFSNLAYDEYDVYVYFSGQFGDTGRNGTITLNGSIAVDVQSLAFSHGPYVEATGGGAQGHYVLFQGVTGSSFTVALDADAGGPNFHMGIFGIQIVDATATSIPSPAALPAGLTLVGLLAARRRR